jgi:thiamine-monophosphate kinase
LTTGPLGHSSRAFGESRAIEFIARAVRHRNPEILKGIGDDAALYRDGLVVTTDAYLEGVHFDRAYMSLQDVGARAACGTLSDIAAMCARPIGVYVSLLAPRGITRRELAQLYHGMDGICREFKTEIAGGDIVASDKLGLALTALGKTRQPRLRSGAKPGDWVFLTGCLALAETGRLALKHGLNPARYRRAIERHLRPIPRIGEAAALARRIHGLIDTSDGLSTDAGHIATESALRIVLEYDKLPVSVETRQLTAELGIDLEPFAVSSGEDYELLFTSPHSVLHIRDSAVALTRIGRVEEGSGVYLLAGGRRRRLRPSGYDHLKGMADDSQEKFKARSSKFKQRNQLQTRNCATAVPRGSFV